MARKRYKPEEIVAKLRQVEVLVSQGQNMVDAIRQIGVSEVTYYRWRQEIELEMVDARDIADVDAAKLVRRKDSPEPLPRQTIEIVGPEAFTGRSHHRHRALPAIDPRRTGRTFAFLHRRRASGDVIASPRQRRTRIAGGRRRMKTACTHRISAKAGRDGAFPGHA
jgi:transposase-like protein